MTLAAISPITSPGSGQDPTASSQVVANSLLNAPSTTQNSTQPSTSSTLSLNPASVLTTSTASVILSTASIPAGAGSQASPPLSTDTIQLLTDLSSGNFTAAKSDVAKVQQDLQNRQPAADTSSSSTLLKQLNTLKSTLEAGNTADALNILTGILAQSSNIAGSILSTSA